MKIAVLAWGSLIWNPKELAVTDGFDPIGPYLPVEFCRVSGDGRLTLVIDEAFGTRCQTYIAPSTSDDLDSALKNLWVREGSEREQLPKDIRTHGRVGFVDVQSGNCSGKAMARHPKSVAAIKTWVETNGFDAAIWTALASNFHDVDRAGVPFSVDAAIHYLKSLGAEKRANAFSYIRNAPTEVQTPVRAAVNKHWPF